MTWIKICGTTNERDADIAIRAGANALGFIMSASPRQVSDTAAYSIGTIVPKGVETIGVFVNEELQTLVQCARFCKFTGVQLHGDEDPEYVLELRKHLPGIRILKAISASALDDVPNLKPDAWLVDSARGAQRGGTGKTFDWKKSQPRVGKLHQPVIVAGGLTPQNVQQALDALRPWGVDVVSGVESYPGRKHPGMVAQFIDAVRQFDARHRHDKAAVQRGIKH
ncbi:MAG TPA: phosphoribosylanthranilate isomerase [Terriglobales bacterium]|nr:phosphoribosylanthranilate isomerase [Terriglobales bacterium]